MEESDKPETEQSDTKKTEQPTVESSTTEASEKKGFQPEMPIITRLLEKIDSRTLFTNGVDQVIRMFTGFSLMIGGLILLVAVFKAFTFESDYMDVEGPTILFAALINLSFFIALFASSSIILKRSTQIQTMDSPTVIKIFFSIIRILIEVSALICLIFALYKLFGKYRNIKSKFI